MAGQRVEQLLVLTGILLLVSVRGWERMSQSELLRFYETGRWREAFSFTAEDDSYDLYNYEDGVLEEAEGVATNETSPEDSVVKATHLSAGETTSPKVELEESKDDDYDNYEDEVPDEVEGLASIEVVGTLMDHIDGDGSDTSSQPDAKKSDFHVEFVGVPPKNWTGCVSPNSEGIDVVCSEDGFKITLPPGRLGLVQVVGFKNISVEDAPKSCGFHLNHLKNILTAGFTGCNVREDVEDIYSLQLFVSISGQTRELVAFCVESTKFDAGQFPRIFSERTKCDKSDTLPAPVTVKPSRCAAQTTTSPPTTDKLGAALLRKWIHKVAVPPVMTITGTPQTDSPVDLNYKSGTPEPPKLHKCAVHVKEQIPCGHSGISPWSCQKRGCCMDLLTYNCYYPLDECTADQHFVFAIRHDCAVVPFDPRKLVIPEDHLCKPAIVNAEVAIFKIKLGECGGHSYEVGDVKIFLIEVQTTVDALGLKHGIITRTDPIRFMIECRYSKHGNAVTENALASVGYMVKTSTSNQPSSIISSGLYDVELKIAKNHTYTSYFPTHHLPLQLLLGHPVYLELSLRSPKPDEVLLVNYCLAYPRSAKNALVLIPEGCAIHNDPTVSILRVDDLSTNHHQRHFTVEAFQFMDQNTDVYLNEEIYFMCSAEVCISSEKTCEEQCFDEREFYQLQANTLNDM